MSPVSDQNKEPLRRMPKVIDTGKPSTSLDRSSPVVPTAATVVTPTGARSTETESKNPFDLDRRYETRVGRSTDYSKVTGQLFFVHVDGGTWVLRYAPLWKEDANGGSVILARDRQMDNYREGDLVTVEGTVLQGKGNSRLGGSLYQVRSIQLVERPQ
jgi:hypothetical protein